MTLEAFCDFLLCGGFVQCDTPQHRNEMAEYIQNELGFQIGPGTRKYIANHPDGVEFMFVGIISDPRGRIVYFSNCASGDAIVTFNSVSHLIEYGSDIDTGTMQEFSNAFSDLMDLGGTYDFR